MSNFAKLIILYGYFFVIEKEKMLSGMIYDANNDSALIAERLRCKGYSAILSGGRQSMQGY